MTNELHGLGVREIADGVAAGTLSPVDVVKALLARIGMVEQRVQAWNYLDGKGALSQAEDLAREAASGQLRGPLHGVPIGIKDEFFVKGMPTGMREGRRGRL